jgi:tetratricopeptide (TPR) repeat protein
LVRQIIAQPEADLYRLLASLQHKEFLYEQPAFPENEYIFKHALTQEVAYGTVLQEQRKLLHERTGQALEAVYTATLQEHYSDLAHHYRRSANAEKAIHYLQLAGQQAVQRSANTEAIDHLTAALELLLSRPETPERATQELALHLAVGPALMSAQGWNSAAAGQHYTRARTLCAQLGNVPQRVPVLWGLWIFHLSRGELHTAQVIAEECLQLAEQTNETALLIPASFAVGGNFVHRGELVRARTALERSVTLYQPHHQALTPLYGNVNPQVFSLAMLAWTLWYLGYPEQALTRVQEALGLAQELKNSYNLGVALGWTTEVCLNCGDGQVAREHAEATVTLCGEQGFSLWEEWGTVQQGATLILQRQWVAGIAQIQKGLEVFSVEIMKPIYLTWLAVGYGGRRQVEEGVAAIAEALRLVEKNDDRSYEAEVWRIKGTLTLQSKTSLGQVEDKSQTSRSPSEVEQEAEACFLKAIEVAQRQQAKSLELRAVMSLARLWQSHGKTAEARLRLAEVYNWFTEGFDTKDLQEAQVLLDELLQT